MAQDFIWHGKSQHSHELRIHIQRIFTSEKGKVMGFFNRLLCRKGQAEKPVTTKSGRGESFQNRYEYDAEYLLIPGGRYRYQYDPPAKTEEKEVSDIYFAKYPVTNKRYRRFIRYLEEKERELLEILPKGEFAKRMIEFASGIEGFGKYLADRPKSWADTVCSEEDTDKRFNVDGQPVVGVSWFAAQAYCFWLSALEEAGRDSASGGARGLYRLPTEIEWEWAAGGDERAYPWEPEKGSPSDKLANYDGCANRTRGYTTTPVGRYPDGATPQGLMDMAGNVFEWMENPYDDDKDFRSLRGGSWWHVEDYLRCSARNYRSPNLPFRYVGFRVVRSR